MARTPSPSTAGTTAGTAVRPWIIYTRVSTDEQAQQGVSLDVQRQACGALLTARGAGGYEVIEDGGFSGGSLDRPGMARLLERIDAGTCAGVCIFAIDRLTRNLRDLLDLVERLEKRGVSLLAVREQIDTSGVMGRFVLSLLGAVAQLEREMIGQRVRAAMAHRKAQGAWVGGQIPVGLAVERDGEGIRRLVPDPATGPILAEAWKLLAQGKTLTDAVTYLNGKGLRTPRGLTWSRTRVHSVVANEIYVGLLVDRGTFEAAHVALGRRSPRKGGRPLDQAPIPSGKAKAPTPLTGLVYCGHCGSALVYGTGTGRHGGVYRYLRCSGRIKRGKDYCPAGDLPAEAFETGIVTTIATSLKDGRLLKAYAEDVQQRRAHADLAKGRLGTLIVERDALQGRMAKVFEVIEGGGLAAQAARGRLEFLQDQMNRLLGDIAAEEATVAAAEMGDRELQAAEAHMRAGLAALSTATPEERATILRGLVAKITTTREKANLDLVGPGSHSCLTWLGYRDSNPDAQSQSLLSYR
jgi:site-specific DNA recombinase